MKYFIIAGEASGDMHGANLVHNILSYDNDAQFRFFGGDMMKNIGGTMVKHYREMAFMGIGEVLMHARRISRNLSLCRKSIIDYQPDVIILVDYAGFNLRIVKFAKNHNFRVYYYILPKLWAWGKWRVKTVKKYVDRMFVLLPFEVDFYKAQGVVAEYYGNPVLDSVEMFRPKAVSFDHFVSANKLQDKPVIALLAGSRKQEIEKLLPEMLQITSHYPDYQFVIAGAPAISPEFYQQFISKADGDIHIVFDQTYQLLSNSTAAVVTSGTATLETALFGIPEVVVYKTSPLTLFVGRFFVHITYFYVIYNVCATRGDGCPCPASGPFIHVDVVCVGANDYFVLAI